MSGGHRRSLAPSFHLRKMSTQEDRFRIPGGSLDLDSDDDHENGTSQVEGDPPVSSPEPPTQIQPIVHLNPAELSRVLSWIPHTLAPLTAEYVLFLNISGNAFRNLELSALDVLANHDSAMGQQLVRIQNGLLPSAPRPIPTEDPASRNHDDGVSSPEAHAVPGGSSELPATTISSPAPLHESLVSPSSSTSSTPSPSAHHATHSRAPTSMQGEECADVTSLVADKLRTGAGVANNSDASSDASHVAEGNDQSTRKVTSPPPSQSDSDKPGGTLSSTGEEGLLDIRSVLDVKTSRTGCAATTAHSEDNLPSPPPSSEPATIAGPDRSSSCSPTSLAAKPSSSSFPHCRCPTSPVCPPPVTHTCVEATGHSPIVTPMTMSDERQSSLPSPPPSNRPHHHNPAMVNGDASGTSSEEQVSSGGYSVAATGEGPPVVNDRDDAQGDVPSVDVEVAQTESLGDRKAVEPFPRVPDAQGNGMGAGGEASLKNESNATTDLEAAPGQTVPVNETATSVGTSGSPSDDRSLSPGQIGGTVDLADCAGIDLKIPEIVSHPSDDVPAAVSKNGMPVPTETHATLSTIIPASSTSSQRDTNTPESCTTTAASVLQTPTAGSVPSWTGDSDTSSRLDLDLLQFSPFALGAKLTHDEHISVSEELSKDDSFSTIDPFLASCEKRFERGENTHAPAALCAQDPNLDFLTRELTPTPLVSTPGSHVPVEESLTVALHEDSSHGEGDNDPILDNDAAPDFGHNKANQRVGSRAGSFYADPTKDFHRGRQISFGLDDESGAGSHIAESLVDISHHPAPAADARSEATSHANGVPLGAQAPLADDRGPLHSRHESKDSSSLSGVGDSLSSAGTCEHRSLLGLSIPVSLTSLEDELTQLSPLFSPTTGYRGRTLTDPPESSAFEQLFSESSFSVSRTFNTPVRLKRGTRMHHVARNSRGTDTSEDGIHSNNSIRVLVDASIQTDTDIEEDHLLRRTKALERELRALRARVRRSDERPHDSKPTSFWRKVASTDRDVRSPEPVNFGFLKDMVWNFSNVGQDSSGTSNTSP